MNYLTDKMETDGAFVLPTTRLGKKLIARCLRKPFQYEYAGRTSRFAGNANMEVPAKRMMRAMEAVGLDGDVRRCVPAFCDEAFDDYGQRDYGTPFDRLVFSDVAGFGAVPKGCTHAIGIRFVRGGASFSRVLARKTWHWSQHGFEFEKALEEQEECVDIATHPGWRITGADKATVETLRAAAERERAREKRRASKTNVWMRSRKEQDRVYEVRETLLSSSRQSRRYKRAQLRALGIPA